MNRGTILVGYDVEDRGSDSVTPRFLEQASRIHRDLSVPATLFVLGTTLERWSDAFGALVGEALFDLQQHTYQHKLLKTVVIQRPGSSVEVVAASSAQEVKEDIARGAACMRKVIGVDPIGLTAPWCYYRGLSDRPDLVRMIAQLGVRFVRSDGRNSDGWQPMPLGVQPYWYSASGHAQLLEIPTHAWHDCNLREHVIGWDDLEGYVCHITPYIDVAAEKDLVLSLCMHDWASIRGDPQMSATRRILQYALDRGLRVITCKAYFHERLAQARQIQ